MVNEITPKELKRRMDEGENLFLLDVREPEEKQIADIGGTLIPQKQINERLNEIPTNETIVVYCRSGGRSRDIAHLLTERGFEDVLNLDGGTLRWADEIDPTIAKY